MDTRDKIIKDQAMRIIAQETNKFYDEIIKAVAKTDLTLTVTASKSGTHIVLSGKDHDYGFTVGPLQERVDYEQATDKFKRLMRFGKWIIFTVTRQNGRALLRCSTSRRIRK